MMNQGLPNGKRTSTRGVSTLSAEEALRLAQEATLKAQEEVGMQTFILSLEKSVKEAPNLDARLIAFDNWLMYHVHPKNLQKMGVNGTAPIPEFSQENFAELIKGTEHQKNVGIAFLQKLIVADTRFRPADMSSRVPYFQYIHNLFKRLEPRRHLSHAQFLVGLIPYRDTIYDFPGATKKKDVFKWLSRLPTINSEEDSPEYFSLVCCPGKETRNFFAKMAEYKDNNKSLLEMYEKWVTWKLVNNSAPHYQEITRDAFIYYTRHFNDEFQFANFQEREAYCLLALGLKDQLSSEGKVRLQQVYPGFFSEVNFVTDLKIYLDSKQSRLRFETILLEKINDMFSKRFNGGNDMSGKKPVLGAVERTRSQTVGGVSVVPSHEVGVKPLSSLTKGRPAAARTRARTVAAATKPAVQLVETSIDSVPPKPPARPSAAALAEYGVGVSWVSQNPQESDPVAGVRVLASQKPLEPPKGRPSDSSAPPPKKPGPFIDPRKRGATVSGGFAAMSVASVSVQGSAANQVPPPVAPRPSREVLARYSLGGTEELTRPPVPPRPYPARPSDGVAASAPAGLSQASPVHLAGLFPMPPTTEPVPSSSHVVSAPGKGNDQK